MSSKSTVCYLYLFFKNQWFGWKFGDSIQNLGIEWVSITASLVSKEPSAVWCIFFFKLICNNVSRFRCSRCAANSPMQSKGRIRDAVHMRVNISILQGSGSAGLWNLSELLVTPGFPPPPPPLLPAHAPRCRARIALPYRCSFSIPDCTASAGTMHEVSDAPRLRSNARRLTVTLMNPQRFVLRRISSDAQSRRWSTCKCRISSTLMQET